MKFKVTAKLELKAETIVDAKNEAYANYYAGQKFRTISSDAITVDEDIINIEILAINEIS